MDLLIKILIYLVMGLALLAINGWYVSALYQNIKGGDLVIGPMRVIGGPSTAAGMDDTLARMLLARWQSILWDLDHSQTSLRRTDESGKTGAVNLSTPAVPGPPLGIAGSLFEKKAALAARVFDPINVDIKVGGVDVGGWLPRIQRWFVEDRILSFSVSFQEHAAIISGNLDALGKSKAKPLWIKVDNPTPESIANEVAFALIQTALARDDPVVGELTSDEFKRLVLSVGRVAEINRRVTALDVAASEDFKSVLATVGTLADRMQKWNELTYFAATIAEGAENYENAVTFYQRLRNAKSSIVPITFLETKLKYLQAIISKAQPGVPQSALEKLREQAAYATSVLNQLFRSNLPVPEIELLPAETHNAYWDGERVRVPPVVQDIPDITYHETAWPFLRKVWDFEFLGQNGALARSYTDILTSLIKQAKLNQKAQQADWVIGPGSVAWIRGDYDAILTDKRPLISLSHPGTAYDKDTQPAHYKDLVITSASNEVLINSGIPNKAFYEAAMRIGSDKAGKIWIDSLQKFDRKTDFKGAARIIHSTAEKLYGSNSAEARHVKLAWEAVGLPITGEQNR